MKLKDVFDDMLLHKLATALLHSNELSFEYNIKEDIKCLFEEEHRYNRKLIEDLSEINFINNGNEIRLYNFQYQYRGDYAKLRPDDFIFYYGRRFPYLIIRSGNTDIEYPLLFVLYFDGEDLRGYIPKDGNVIDFENKCLVDLEDYETITDIYKKYNLYKENDDDFLYFKYDKEKIFKDINNYFNKLFENEKLKNGK